MYQSFCVWYLPCVPAISHTLRRDLAIRDWLQSLCCYINAAVGTQLWTYMPTVLGQGTSLYLAAYCALEMGPETALIKMSPMCILEFSHMHHGTFVTPHVKATATSTVLITHCSAVETLEHLIFSPVCATHFNSGVLQICVMPKFVQAEIVSRFLCETEWLLRLLPYHLHDGNEGGVVCIQLYQ